MTPASLDPPTKVVSSRIFHRWDRDTIVTVSPCQWKPCRLFTTDKVKFQLDISFHDHVRRARGISLPISQKDSTYLASN